MDSHVACTLAGFLIGCILMTAMNAVYLWMTRPIEPQEIDIPGVGVWRPPPTGPRLAPPPGPPSREWKAGVDQTEYLYGPAKTTEPDTIKR